MRCAAGSRLEGKGAFPLGLIPSGREFWRFWEGKKKDFSPQTAAIIGVFNCWACLPVFYACGCCLAAKKQGHLKRWACSESRCCVEKEWRMRKLWYQYSIVFLSYSHSSNDRWGQFLSMEPFLSLLLSVGPKIDPKRGKNSVQPWPSNRVSPMVRHGDWLLYYLELCGPRCGPLIRSTFRRVMTVMTPPWH